MKNETNSLTQQNQNNFQLKHKKHEAVEIDHA